MSQPRNDTLKTFIVLLKPHRRWIAAGVGLGWIAVLSSVGLLALSGWFISATAFAGLTTATAAVFNFFFPSGGVRLFAITRTAARYAERLATHQAALRMLATLRVWFYRKVEPLAPARLMQYRSGDLLNRIVADIESLDNLYVRVLSPSIVAVLTIVSVVLFLFFFDPRIAAAAALFFATTAFGVPFAVGRAAKRAGGRLPRQTAALRTRIIESVEGLSELLVYGAWDNQKKLLRKDSGALIDQQLRMSLIRATATAVTTLLTGLAVTTCLFIAVGGVRAGALNGANLALIGLAVLAVFEALSPLPGAYQYLEQTREAGRRLLELVDAPAQVRFPKESGAMAERFDLCLDKIHFRYTDNDPWVFQGLCLNIAQGRRVAILGETGAGKSTLLNLLARFWDPIEGTITLGGHDIKTFTESSLRRTIGVVSQQSHLFNATVRQNLLMANPDADDESLRRALAESRLLDVVEALPEGLDTWIGEGGRALSGGQARRLSLARAFVQNAPIWVMDEPTEGLDRVTEQKVMNALLSAHRDKTVLLITHRTAGLDQFDEIVLMEQGRIIAQGGHDVLLKTSTRYAALVRPGLDAHRRGNRDDE